jgi:hypothetical protein
MSTENSGISPEIVDKGLPQPDAQQESAWEELHTGAYVPIRVRGSWRGGVLG